MLNCSCSVLHFCFCLLPFCSNFIPKTQTLTRVRLQHKLEMNQRGFCNFYLQLMNDEDWRWRSRSRDRRGSCKRRDARCASEGRRLERRWEKLKRAEAGADRKQASAAATRRDLEQRSRGGVERGRSRGGGARCFLASEFWSSISEGTRKEASKKIMLWSLKFSSYSFRCKT